MKKLNKLVTLITCFVLLLTFTVGCAKEAPKGETTTTDASKPADEAKPAEGESKKLRAAMLLSGPINDGGWNTDAYNGLKECEAMGFEIAYTENVTQADIDMVIRDYAKNGFDFIIGHGFEYGDSLATVAEEYPDIKFLQIGGSVENGKNLASGEFRLGQLSYILAGIAARMTKTNKIGFVGAMEIPTIQAEVETLQRVVPEVNPNASVTVAYIGSWTDVNKGKEAAKAQINNGVDVIVGIGDACDAGALQACQEAEGVYFLGWSGDFNKMDPKLVLTSGVQSVASIVSGVGKDILAGKFEAAHKVYGIAEGKEYLGVFSDTVPADIKEKALQEQEDIKTGKIVLPDLNQ